MIRVAGVDIGFTEGNPTALAIVEVCPKPVLVHYESFYPYKAARTWEDAIDHIGGSLGAFLALAGFGSDYLSLLAYEMPHVRTNTQTAIKLAHLCGIVRCVATTACINVTGVQPTQAKKALTGSGAAKKAQMVEAAFRLFGERLSEHEADACGIALAGAHLAGLICTKQS